MASASVVNQKVLSGVNEGVLKVHQNQKKLEAETQELLNLTDRFARQTSKWLTLYQTMESAVTVNFSFITFFFCQFLTIGTW